jgi:hypothetical protein
MSIAADTPPSETDIAKTLAILVAIVQKYRPDVSRLVEILFGNKPTPAGYQAIAGEPSLKQFFRDVGRIAASLENLAQDSEKLAWGPDGKTRPPKS